MKKILSFLFLLSLCSCECKDQNEIDNWTWGPHSIKGICPLNECPVKIWPEVAQEEVKKAIAAINKDVGATVLQIHELGFPVREADPMVIGYHRYCDPVKIHDGSDPGTQFPHSYGWNLFTGKPGKWNIIIYMCLKKHKDAIGLMSTPAGQRAKEVGLYGYIKHELVHPLIGPNHPKSYAQLMSKNQRITEMHYHTKELIRQTIISRCNCK